MPSKGSGKLVVIEGIDKSGKSTLCKKICEKLHLLTNEEIISTGFPNRKSVTGKIIDQYLKSKVQLNPETIHLLFSANRWEELDFLKNICGKIVICDRYSISGAVYTTAKGVSLDWATQSDVGLPIPDLVVFLDVDARTAAQRQGYGDEKYDSIVFQQKCYDLMRPLVEKHPNGIIVDGHQSADQIAQIITKRIMDL